MLKDEIRAQMIDAMKQKRALERGILKVVLGEIETIESRGGDSLDDDAVIKIVRKLIKSNEESMEATADPARRETLAAETEILESLVPAALDAAAIVEALAPVGDEIRGAKADGPAMGIAMRHLKSTGAVVESRDVNAAVRTIRG